MLTQLEIASCAAGDSRSRASGDDGYSLAAAVHCFRLEAMVSAAIRLPETFPGRIGDRWAISADRRARTTASVAGRLFSCLPARNQDLLQGRVRRSAKYQYTSRDKNCGL
jgi:hypothetical protein